MRVAHACFDDYMKVMTPLTVNTRKSNRRSLTMLAALVAIAILGHVVGLVIHYGFARHSVVGGERIVPSLTSNVSATSQALQ
jgi:hypothetical protein